MCAGAVSPGENAHHSRLSGRIGGSLRQLPLDIKMAAVNGHTYGRHEKHA
jgi:hypothetical protein